MPNGGGCSEERGGAGGRGTKRVEIAGAIAPGDHVLGLQILHRKAKRIKLDGAVIVDGKMTNGNKFLIMLGDTKTLSRTRLRCGKEKACDPTAVTVIVDGKMMDGNQILNNVR
jgi:hypothetical protein